MEPHSFADATDWHVALMAKETHIIDGVFKLLYSLLISLIDDAAIFLHLVCSYELLPLPPLLAPYPNHRSIRLHPNLPSLLLPTLTLDCTIKNYSL